MLWNKQFVSYADPRSHDIMVFESICGNDIVSDHSLMVHKTLFPRFAKRSTDTKVMSLFHGHDLTFRSFTHTLKLTSTSYCEICPSKTDNNKHQLLECPRFNCDYRDLFSNLDVPDSLAHGILTQMDLAMLRGLRIMAQIIVQ